MTITREQRIAALKATAKERILIIDGAMGTMIQRYKFDEAAFRGTRFAGHGKPVQGNNDLLVLRHNRTRFEPIVRYPGLATTATWTQPVLSGNRIFIKDVSSLTLWTTD